MATVVWAGTTSTDIGDGSNWVGAAFPGTGDTALWNTVTPFAMASGTATNAITNLVITDGAGTQGMGTSGGTCSWGNVTGYMQIGNRAAGHWITSSGTIAQLKLEMPNAATAYLITGTVTTAIGTNVTVSVAAAATLTNALSTNTTWNVAIKGTAITLWQGTGFVNTTSRNITTCKAGPGSIITLAGTSIIATAADFYSSTLVFQSSGTLPTSTLIAGINLFKGSLLTVAGNPNATAAGGTVVVYPGANVIDTVPGCSLTVTKIMAGPSAGGTVPPS